jgi:1-phosphatidylinositol phosphodiesterase
MGRLNDVPLPRFLAPSRVRRTPTCLITCVAVAMALIYILISLAPCSIGGRGACYNGYQSRFSFDADLASHADWMADLPDAANLTGLSIPGTHDTMTYEMPDQTLQCQNWNLTTQLHAGLRYFDIRGRVRDDRIAIYHADGDTGFVLTDVLTTLFDFLDAHPSETVIMRLEEEGKPVGDNDSLSFEDVFNYYRRDCPETSAGADRHLFLYDRTSPIPTLGALRGKIFLLQNFKATSGGPYGLEWGGKQMALEDLWIIPDVYHLAEKWTAIRDALERAALAAADDNDFLYLAHLSASVGVIPIEAAAGPLNRTVVGMNDMTGQWLTDFRDDDEVVRTGVVIIDFPGNRLIDIIIRWNKLLLKSMGMITKPPAH